MEILAFLLCLGSSSASSPPPHIIFILADDLGVNDVGWVNPNIVTPNLGGNMVEIMSSSLFRFSGSKWSGFGTALCSVPVHTLEGCPDDQQVAFFQPFVRWLVKVVVARYPYKYFQVPYKYSQVSIQVLSGTIQVLSGIHTSTGDREGF